MASTLGFKPFHGVYTLLSLKEHLLHLARLLGRLRGEDTVSYCVCARQQLAERLGGEGGKKDLEQALFMVTSSEGVNTGR